MIMCENILWQFCLGRYSANDEMKKAAPILHGRNRSHLPTLSHKRKRTRLAISFSWHLFPHSSLQEAIAGPSLDLCSCSWPSLCQNSDLSDSRQEAMQEHPPCAMDLQGQNIFCGWLFISRIAQREFWASGSTMYISKADRDAPNRQRGTKVC